MIEVNQKHEIPQERYTYEMKHNVNVSIGIMKSYFVKSIIEMKNEKSKNALEQIDKLMVKHLIPVRKDRQFTNISFRNMVTKLIFKRPSTPNSFMEYRF